MLTKHLLVVLQIVIRIYRNKINKKRGLYGKNGHYCNFIRVGKPRLGYSTHCD